MARAYTVGAVALALDIPAKWIDNILSHHTVRGVAQKRQGVSRKVSLEGLLQLALAISLIEDLQIPAFSALRLASTLTDTGGHHRTPAGISFDLDLAAIRAHLETRLAQAVEIAPLPRRGRPPRSTTRPSSKTGRLD